MDYDLSRLGDRQFEHLAQALFQHYVGTGTSAFGDGPDGGREATWEGRVSERSRLPSEWDGYGVVQAKYKERAFGSPASQAKWLLAQLKSELTRWADPASNRKRRPDFFLAVTNAVLSPGVDGGIETVTSELEEHASALGLALRGIEVWHYDSIRLLLDDAPNIRTTYSAWITPGDVLARVLDEQERNDGNLLQALSVYLAKRLIEDTHLNLAQAGSVSEASTRIEDVFIDLPLTPSFQLPESDNWGAAARIVESANAVGTSETRRSGDTPPHIVLIGGPGQGKSTVGQFLCQAYRAQLLEGHPVAAEAEVKATMRRVLSQCEAIQLPVISAKRWPVNVKLTDFADSLAEGECSSLLEYLCSHVVNKSGYQVEVDQIRFWLASYPWIVFLDGLDEVPASSNRSDLLGAIRDFSVDIAALTADVMLVVTTRPQGYSGDFERRDYIHLTLAPLPVRQALTYGRKLLALRAGAESDRYARSVARLQRAAREEATSRLMSTPLQVSIMTLLIERQGQAPKDRWRLFSQYYRLIYQREQEKGGPLAEILNDYESDINAVHYEVGHTLQLRAEQAGDTESLLSMDDLRLIFSRRLQSEGYAEADAVHISESFVTVTTDRLVFLTAQRAGRFGFEIRSLQEFMAGEYLVDLSETDLLPSLESVGAAAHWRNALLFAIGKVFAERQKSRETVITLCTSLNVRSQADTVTMQGSRLALAIILDGVSRGAPSFRHMLAGIACQLLQLPPTAETESIARLREHGEGELLDGALGKALQAGIDSQLSAARVLAVEADANNERAQEKLDALFVTTRDADLQTVASMAWHSQSRAMAEVLNNHLHRLSSSMIIEPERFESTRSVAARKRRYKTLSRVEHKGEYDDMSAVDALHRILDVRAEFGELIFGDGLPLSVTYIPLRHQRGLWQRLAEILPAGETDWAGITRICQYNATPGIGTLVAALQAICDMGAAATYPFISRSSWPLNACWQSATARSWHVANGDTKVLFHEEIARISDGVANGMIGDAGDWEAIEEGWSTVLDSDTIGLVSSVVVPPDLLWAPTHDGVNLSALLAGARGVNFPVAPSTIVDASALIETATKLFSAAKRLPHCAQKHAMTHLAFLYVGSREEDSWRDQGFDTDDRVLASHVRLISQEKIIDDIYELTEQLRYSNYSLVAWTESLQESDLDRPPILELLKRAGMALRPYLLVHGSVRQKIAEKLGRMWTLDSNAMSLGRLSFFLGSTPKPPLVTSDNQLEIRLRLAIAMLTGESALEQDQLLEEIAKHLLLGNDGKANLNWRDQSDFWYLVQHPAFLRNINGVEDPRASLAARFVQKFAHQHPVASARILDELTVAIGMLASGRVEPAAGGSE